MHEPDPSTTKFTLWSIFRRDPARAAEPPCPEAGAELAEAAAGLAADGVVVRGFYDASGFRADADLMVWMHGGSAEALQDAVRRLRRTRLLGPLLPTWAAMGVHKEAEFSPDHRPGFVRGEAARQWLVVYPFVRSYEWYLLPAAERRQLLADHGGKGAAFTNVVTHTVAAFGLGDYEWVLPLESDDLTAIVDLLRTLRDTGARRHVRVEVPFFTGRRVAVEDLPAILA